MLKKRPGSVVAGATAIASHPICRICAGLGHLHHPFTAELVDRFAEEHPSLTKGRLPTLMRQPSSKCCGLQTLKWTNGATIQAVEWSADQKSVFINGWERGAKSGSIWRENEEGSEPEKLTENCGFAFDASSDGKYLLSLIAGGDIICIGRSIVHSAGT
jgi:hypothetical protein